MTRRIVLKAIVGLAGIFLGESVAGPAIRRARRRRRRIARRVRRRIRRRVAFRIITGRRLLVVPMGVAAGWELMLDNRVVVVKEVRVVDAGPQAKTIIVVRNDSGTEEEIEAIREDTRENAKLLKGSVLPDDDSTTPSVQSEEIEVIEE